MTAGWRAAIVLALLLSVHSAAPITAGADDTRSVDLSTSQGSLPAQYVNAGQARQLQNGTNDSTVQHVHPRTDSGRPNASTGELLLQLLGDRIVSGAVLLAAGAYDRAREQLGPEFDADLRRYQRFVAATPIAADDNASTALRQAGQAEQELIVAVASYEQAITEYREARRAGDEQRARETARQLHRLAREINSTSSDLQRSYERLSSATDRNLTNATTAIDAVAANVTEIQSGVQDVSLVTTRLRVTVNRTNISATRPLIVTGQLISENGTALNNRTIRLRVGERVNGPRTQTGTNGTFELRYRPASVPVGSMVATVEFVPELTSRFERSNSTIEIEISQERPTLSVATTPSVARFDESVSVTGQLRVDNVSLAGVPLVVSYGNRTLGFVRTGSDGRYNHTMRLPLAIPTGQVPVRVRADYRGRAIAPVTRNTTLTVRRTETAISVNATNTSDRRITVRGYLNASEGDGIPNQQVVITLDGAETDRVITTANGSYRTTVDVPPEVVGPNATEISVGARFDATGTNLGPSTTRTTVLLPGTGAPVSVGFVDRVLSRIRNAIPLGLVPVGILLLVGGGVYLRRRRSVGGRDTAVENGRSAGGGDGESKGSAPMTAPEEPPQPSGADAVEGEYDIEAARQRLSEGSVDSAIELAYAAFKRRVASAYDLDPTQTHWEFYAACVEAAPDGQGRDTFEWLTATYERAAFAPGGLTRADAERYVREVEDIDSAEAFGD